MKKDILMSDKRIVRFTKNGCGYDPTTRQTLPRGTNVMYHPVFWDVSPEAARKVAKEHNANLVYCD